MSGAVLSFCGMAIAARALLDHMGVFQILFFRTGIALLIVLVLIYFKKESIRTAKFNTHLWRNIFHLGGQASWVFALGALPLATVFAIEFTSPIFTAVLAVLMLGERLDRGRVAMLVLGFAGVLVILRPGYVKVDAAALVMIFGSFCFAVQMIGTKRLSGTDAPLTVLFWMSVIQTPFCLAVAIPGWVAPGWQDAPWLLAMGVGSFTAHYCLTSAMRHADATIVVPVDFFRLPLIALVGAVFYAEPFDLAVLLGAAMICAGTWFSLARQTRRVS